MTTRVIDYDPLSGETVLFHDNQDGSFNIEHLQSRRVIDALMDGNKDMANDSDFTRRGIKKDWWKYATVPNIIIMKWRNELGVDFFDKNDRKKVFQLLNHPDYRHLKTTRGWHQPSW